MILIDYLPGLIALIIILLISISGFVSLIMAVESDKENASLRRKIDALERKNDALAESNLAYALRIQSLENRRNDPEYREQFDRNLPRLSVSGKDGKHGV